MNESFTNYFTLFLSDLKGIVADFDIYQGINLAMFAAWLLILMLKLNDELIFDPLVQIIYGTYIAFAGAVLVLAIPETGSGEISPISKSLGWIVLFGTAGLMKVQKMKIAARTAAERERERIQLEAAFIKKR